MYTSNKDWKFTWMGSNVCETKWNSKRCNRRHLQRNSHSPRTSCILPNRSSFHMSIKFIQIAGSEKERKKLVYWIRIPFFAFSYPSWLVRETLAFVTDVDTSYLCCNLENRTNDNNNMCSCFRIHQFIWTLHPKSWFMCRGHSLLFSSIWAAWRG